MTQTHEFASQAWLQALCDLIDKKVADSGVDLRGVDYVFGEEFVDVPPRLLPAGAERVGWVVRVRDGVVTSAVELPPADADSNNIADWETVEPLAHHVFGADTARDAEVGTLAAQLEADGKLERIVRTPMPPQLRDALGGMHWLHNAVVAMTSPRQG
ncbi:MAG TPA: hypothetical protein VHC63_08295 [Acidimicrobiales bacterium]|nr:hypothetical protein [Acidimicrobiales bacterium]